MNFSFIQPFWPGDGGARRVWTEVSRQLFEFAVLPLPVVVLICMTCRNMKPCPARPAPGRSRELEFAMGTFSIWHMLILLAVALLLFGKGKISEIMGDFAKGIKSFKKGMAEDEDVAKKAEQPKVIDAQAKTPDAPGQQTRVG
jgi:sec-independent protein translocase protein TatA